MAKGVKPTNGFQPGKSGNPGGRPKIAGEIRALAEEKTYEAFLRIVKIGRMADEKDCPPKVLSIALAANQYIVDRACGRPAQAVNLGDNEGGPLEISVTIREKDAVSS